MSRVERGQLDGLTIASMRRVCASVGATLELTVKWRGPLLDRLVDEAHARLCARVVEILERAGWEAYVEVSYSHFGERGSVDVMGLHPATGSVVVVEVKTMIVSVEELLRSHDAKVRLARQIVHDRWGWQPKRVGRLLVVEGSTANRTRIRTSAALVTRVMPGRAADARLWLAEPDTSSLSAVWFVRPRPPSGPARAASPQRVRRPSGSQPPTNPDC